MIEVRSLGAALTAIPRKVIVAMGETTTIARGRLAYNSQFRYSIKPAGIALASTAMSGPDETLSVTGLVHGYGTLTLTTNAGSIDVELVVTPPHNTWTTMSPMPYPLVFTYAAVIEGRIYVLDNHGYVICYNPRTNTWDRSSGAHLKYCQERWWLNLGAIGGKLYAAFGGLYVTDEIPVEAYDPHADTWTVVSDSLPTGKDHSASGVINGKLYVVGGDGGQYLAVQAGVMEFSPVTSQWTDKITAPIERNNLGSAVIGEKLYAIGGYPATATNDFGPLRTVGVYDAASNTYSERPDLALPAARIGMGRRC